MQKLKAKSVELKTPDRKSVKEQARPGTPTPQGQRFLQMQVIVLQCFQEASATNNNMASACINKIRVNRQFANDEGNWNTTV